MNAIMLNYVQEIRTALYNRREIIQIFTGRRIIRMWAYEISYQILRNLRATDIEETGEL